MKKSTVLAGGFAGATAVTLLHEGIRRVIPQAPHLDRLGMQAVSKGLKKAGLDVPQKNTLFTMALAGDLLSNAIYYSAAGLGNERNIWLRSSMLGLAAGLSAVLLPSGIGLDKKHTNRTLETKLITIGLYVTGALVTTAVIKLLNCKKKKNYNEWERKLVTSAMG